MRLLYFLYFCRRKVVKDFRCKILRGKQVRILYSTRCCEFHPTEPQKPLSEDGKAQFRKRVRKPATLCCYRFGR